MIPVGEAQRRKPPGIFEVGVERKAVGFHRERSAVAKQLHGAIEIVRESVLEDFAPGRRARWQTAHGESDRRKVEASINPAAAVEADLLVIQRVKIVDQAADSKTLVV